MDITSFVVRGREQALLYGDYSTYHGQLARRLLSSRKKLGIVTKNRGKFQKKAQATVEDVGNNNEYVHHLLLASERAWAQAMSIKAAHSAAQNDIAGRTRSHIVSRLSKAAQTSRQLVDILAQPASNASSNDLLEAKAYSGLISGAMHFEKHSWQSCLQNYSAARVIYSALASSGNSDLFKDLLSETIDPSIRYAAYQLKMPRTVPVPTISKQSFPRSDTKLVNEINKLDATALAEGDEAAKLGGSAENAPRSITWRSREVQIEDAQISLAWGAVDVAKANLAKAITQVGGRHPHDVAAVYDEILTATQDAVDATKHAIDELKAEGVGQSDARMQRLQITRTAVNYEMVSWRIGRNRVLTGKDDGAAEDYSSRRRKAPKVKDASVADQKKERELPPSKKLAKLKEKVALYDGTLQNLESIKELPGVAGDEDLATRIDGYEKYFAAVKCLSIARSHAIAGNLTNALALINHSVQLCQKASSELPNDADVPATSAVSIDVSREAVSALDTLLNGELHRHQALVHMDNLRNEEREAASANTAAQPALVTQLHKYPLDIDLSRIVDFPPKMELISLKPIFLDVAWNYIEYPGKTPAAAAASEPAFTAQGAGDGEDQPRKKGWFGFGR